MDGSGTAPPEWTDTAVLVHANHFQFRAGQDTWIRAMGSRMLLWCIAGAGTAVTGGERFPLRPGQALLMPWMSDIRYLADRQDPFLTGAVHLLPWHDPDRPIEARAGHGTDDPLNHAPHRRDLPWPGFARARRIDPPGAAAVIRLAEAAVDAFEEDGRDEASLRAFGLLIARAIAARTGRAEPAAPVPPLLLALQEYARSHLGEDLSTRALAGVIGCSTSTVERQFRRHAGASPTQWVRAARLTAAARLLRTSSRSVTDIAAEVGFADPLHFSRVFRHRYGTSPTRYARRTPLI